MSEATETCCGRPSSSTTSPTPVRGVRRRCAPTAPAPGQRAVKLYYAVRDGLRYEVYGADLSRTGMRASAIIERGYGFCIHKSLVYAAALRVGRHAEPGAYGDVRNHLASPRLRELVGGDVFRFHSLTRCNCDGQWLKATPVFNKHAVPALPDRAAGVRRPHRQPSTTPSTSRAASTWSSCTGTASSTTSRTSSSSAASGPHHPQLFASNDTTATGSLVDEPPTSVNYPTIGRPPPGPDRIKYQLPRTTSRDLVQHRRRPAARWRPR